MNQTISGTLAAAVRHHRAGRLDRAARLYGRILSREPGHADSLHLLGLVAAERGALDAAAASIARAIGRNPTVAAYYANLGLVLARQGAHDRAVLAYRQALELEPANAATLIKRGRSLGEIGRLNEAAASFREAARLAPDAESYGALAQAMERLERWEDAARYYRRVIRFEPASAEAHHRLGNALHLAGKMAEAGAAYRESLRLDPARAEAWHNLGVTETFLHRTGEAVAAYREAIRHAPQAVASHNNLGNLLHAGGRIEEAIAHYRRALEADPGYVEARYNLALALEAANRNSQAMECYAAVLARRPDHFEAHNNLGNSWLARGDPLRARECYREALRLCPGHAEANWNLALADLQLGDFESGWEGYEWRFRQPGAVPRRFAEPLWDGSPLAGRRILLYAEQGLGDTLQFVRYVPLVHDRGGRVVLESPPALVPLLATLDGLEMLVARGDPLPPFDCHSPLMSLPRIFRTTLATIPARVPYLNADPRLVESWRARVDDGGRRHVGIAWGGNPSHKNDRNRSMRLAHFAALAGVRDLSLYSVQLGPQAEELRNPPPGLRVEDLGVEIRDIADTAAILMNLDLVLSVDTMIAHLAGALGRPVWTLLPFAADWRWMTGRSGTPWYPTMRLFRQTSPGDWDSVMREVVLGL